jgi:bifunctional enzyme CysN/CysC
MFKVKERSPHVSTKFKANVFWMGQLPLVKGKTYKLKIATQHVPAVLSDIVSVLDASELSSIQHKQQIDRHDVAECVLETLKPVAFDEIGKISETGRFVIVDNYEICGGGIIIAPVFEEKTAIQEYVQKREYEWERSEITSVKRSHKYQHKSALVILTGEMNTGKQKLARALEEALFKSGKFVYYLGLSNSLSESLSLSQDKTLTRLNHIEHLGELARVMTDSGLVLITSISDIDEYELKLLKSLNQPNKTVVINIGESRFSETSLDLGIENVNDIEQAVLRLIQFVEAAVVLDPEYFL